MRPPRIAALFALVALNSPAVASAWSPNPSIGTTVSNSSAASAVRALIADGEGGTFVAWEDLQGTYSARVQHLDAEGKAQWATNGVALATTSGNAALSIALVADGAGGVIAVTAERRSAPTAYDIFAQRISEQGARLWGTDGVTLCNAALDQIAPVACSDGAGGAILAWEDARNTGTTGTDLFAQRVTAAGVASWTASGVPVVVNAALQNRLEIVGDGEGGALVAWEDSRSLGGNGVDLYAQRLRGTDGARQWSTAGVAVSTAASTQDNVDMIEDGAGGAILVWEDNRNASTSWDIYAEQLNGAGQLASFFATSNVPVCRATGSQLLPRLASDGLGGAIVAWTDTRAGLGLNQVFAQRMLAGLIPGWATDGVALQASAVSSTIDVFGVVSDAMGGADIAWRQASEIQGQRLSGSGAAQWTTGGIRLQTHFGGAANSLVCSDGRGGLVAAFSQVRGLTAEDVFAARTDIYGFHGPTEPVITSVRDVANDQGGRLKVEFTASYLESDAIGAVTLYNVFRSVPTSLLADKRRAGWAIVDDAAAVERDPAHTLLAVAGEAYELVSTISALDVPAYSTIVPTLGDSVAGSFPTTVVMIQARGSFSRYWSSAPASGYSVDDLAPQSPAAFAGQYTAGTMRLHWLPNTEADLAGYRLYRGDVADFAADAAHRIAEPPDTGYVDMVGAPFLYKLTAVDVHGNESPVTLVGAGATLDAPVAIGSGVRLAPPSPNPAAEWTTLEFTLPRTGALRLTLYDTSGRRVRVLHDGVAAAGTHRGRYSLTDDAGRGLAPGVYRLRLETDGRVLSRTLVNMR